MGFVPDWIRSSMCKTGTASKDSAKPATKFGIVSRELFHNAPKFADGGEVNAKGETMGEYSGDDEIVKYRMNQIDDKGNDLRIPESAKTTQSQMDVQDMENGSGSTPSRDFDAGPNLSSEPKSSPAKSSPDKSVPKAKAKAAPNRDFDAGDDSTSVSPRDGYQRSVALKDMTVPKEKPFIDIPKKAAGLQQYRSDAVSPAETLYKKMTSGSQRTKAAKKSKDN